MLANEIFYHTGHIRKSSSFFSISLLPFPFSSCLEHPQIAEKETSRKHNIKGMQFTRLGNFGVQKAYFQIKTRIYVHVGVDVNGEVE